MRRTAASFGLSAIATFAIFGLTPALAAQSLEDRVQALEDQRLVERLVVVEYAKALDAFDAKAYAALFTTDGILNLVGREFKGKAAIEAMFANPASMGPPRKPGDHPPPPRPKALPGQILTQHVITNTNYIVTGNSATGRCYFQEVTTVSGRPQIVNSGHYDDILTKENGTWKFTRRNIMQDSPPAVSDSPSSEKR